jgi:hypothetical protein
MFEAGTCDAMVESPGDLTSGHGAIASRHMVTISEGLRVGRIGSRWESGNGGRCGTGFSAELLTYHLMLPSIILGEFFGLVMAMHDDSHDDPWSVCGPRGGETERMTGNPNPLGPEFDGRGLTVLQSAQ